MGIHQTFLNVVPMLSLLSLTLDPISLLVGNATTLPPLLNATWMQVTVPFGQLSFLCTSIYQLKGDGYK